MEKNSRNSANVTMPMVRASVSPPTWSAPLTGAKGTDRHQQAGEGEPGDERAGQDRRQHPEGNGRVIDPLANEIQRSAHDRPLARRELRELQHRKPGN